MNRAPFLARELLKSLESSDGERAAAAFIANNAILARWAFGSAGGHASYVLHEFPIGIRYKADFVVISSWSGTWQVVFVELEPVSARLVTKSGVPTKRVAGAIGQIVEWDDYVINNRAAVQQDLANWCKRKDKLNWETKGQEPSNLTGDKLRDARTHVHYEYGLVVGRRSEITADARFQAQKFANRIRFTLRSYDVFVDIAEKLDRQQQNPDQSVSLMEFNGV